MSLENSTKKFTALTEVSQTAKYAPLKGFQPENGTGGLAQLVRALASHARSRWFESSISHHFKLLIFNEFYIFIK